MSIDYIRDTYRVPAKIGGRVRYTGDGAPQIGTIVGSRNAHIMVLIDGDAKPAEYHPTWEMEYLPEESSHDNQ